MDATDAWPPELPVAATRVARPTDRLSELRAFYGGLIGLPEIAAFEGHAGYSGVVYGLPGAAHQLEFTSHEDGSPAPEATPENLVVLYFACDEVVDRLAERIAAAGHRPVAPENPYWETVVSSVTFEDPDGWRVTLVRPRGA